MNTDDPTEALKQFIQVSSYGKEVFALLERQRAAGATATEAHDALQTYLLGQMFARLRQENPLLAAYQEAQAVRDIDWWRLLYDLGWGAGDSPEEIPW